VYFLSQHIQQISGHSPGGEAYHCLVQLLPWWPSLKASRSLEIVGLFSKMQSFAHEVTTVEMGEGNDGKI
jgi:hypothetical protein